jgi:serine/threonine protein kinase
VVVAPHKPICTPANHHPTDALNPLPGALLYLHQHDIVHGDLTLNNVLLNSSTRDSRRWVCKVGAEGRRWLAELPARGLFTAAQPAALPCQPLLCM